VHAGASGVGTAAIQMIRAIAPKCKIFITAGSDEKIEYCKKLGADVGINYKKEEQWEKLILNETQSKGVEILIDFVAANYWKRNVECLGMDGIMVMLAFLGGTKAPEFDLSPFLRKRITITGSTLRNRPVEYKTKLTKELEQFLIPRLKDKTIKPVVDKVFEMEKVVDAHKYMEQNQNSGKIVMKILY